MNKKIMYYATASIVSAIVLSSANAEVVTGTNLSVNLESAHIIGSGRNINALRVPVINVDNGITTFFDVSFKLTLDSSGALIFDRFSSASISPPLNSLNFIPGKYLDGIGKEFILEEPSLLSGGRVLYTLSGNSFSLQFVTGSAIGHPDIGGREIATDLNDSHSYGLITDDTVGISSSGGVFRATSSFWKQNQLIGVRQNNNNLQITLFSEGTEDFNSQRAGAILTRVVE